MPEAEEPKPSTKTPKRPAESAAEDAIGQATEIARKYQNHIVIGLCLAILGVFGWKWWSGQKSLKESWAWQGLKEGATIEQLEKAVEAYSDTAAAPFLRLQLAKTYHDEGKLAEAKKRYEELEATGGDHLAVQLARGRLRDLKKEEEFVKLLPGKLEELAKNAPPALPVEVNPNLGQQEAFGPPRDQMTPVEPPK